MLDSLIKSFMPKDFDMEKVTAALMEKAGEVSEILAIVKAQEIKIEFLGKQLQAVIYRTEPQARPIEAWLTTEGNGEKRKFVSLENPLQTGVTSEDIAENMLNIEPLYL